MCVRGAALRPSNTINDSGTDFGSSCRPNRCANSGSMNWVEAPLSIIAEAGFQGISLLFSLTATGITIGSPHPRSAELADKPVEPNPWFPRAVLGRVLTRVQTGFSIRSRISCAIRSPILTWKVISEWLINKIFTDPR